MLNRLVNLFKRLRKKKVAVATPQIEKASELLPRSGEGKGRCSAELSRQGVNSVTPPESASTDVHAGNHSRPENLRQRTPFPVLVRKSGQEATRKPISKFMKHGHQAPWYRKSVKAKVRPEDEDD